MAANRLARLVVSIAADISEMQKGMGDGLRFAQNFGRQATRLGRDLSAKVTLPMVGLGAAAVKMAADGQEAASKMQAVFGDATDDMNRWILGLQSTIPATRAQLQGMTSEIQDLLVPLGMAPSAAQDMTKEVVTLAGDLASFNNIPIQEAMERLRSGLVGQYEPLLKFGVALSASSVKAEALRMGLIREGEELDANARAQASFSLIMQGTTAAQGDAAKTADSAANSFKFLWAAVKDLADTVGQNLLPIVTPMVQKLTEWFKGLENVNPAVLKAGLVVAGLAAALGPLLLVVGQVALAVAGLGPVMMALGPIVAGLAAPFALGVGAFVALGAAAKAVYDNWEILSYEVRTIGRKIVEGLVGGIKDAAGWVKDQVTGFFQDNVLGAAKSLLGIQSPSKEFQRLGEMTVAGFVEGLFSKDMGSVMDQWGSMLKNAAMQGLSKHMGGLFGKLFGGVLGALPGGSFLTSIFAGGFAAGGKIPPGKIGLTGEAGMELVAGPATVTPLSELAVSGAGPAGNLTLLVNFLGHDGSNLAETITHRQKRNSNLDEPVTIPTPLAFVRG